MWHEQLSAQCETLASAPQKQRLAVRLVVTADIAIQPHKDGLQPCTQLPMPANTSDTRHLGDAHTFDRCGCVYVQHRTTYKQCHND
jgi:hypothetical protein